MTDLTGKTIAFLVAAEGIEQVELTEPWQVVDDGNQITSRNHDDLPAFCDALVEAVA